MKCACTVRLLLWGVEVFESIRYGLVPQELLCVLEKNSQGALRLESISQLPSQSCQVSSFSLAHACTCKQGQLLHHITLLYPTLIYPLNLFAQCYLVMEIFCLLSHPSQPTPQTHLSCRELVQCTTGMEQGSASCNQFKA